LEPRDRDQRPDKLTGEFLRDRVKRICADGFFVNRTDEAVEKGIGYIITGAPGPQRSKKPEQSWPNTFSVAHFAFHLANTGAPTNYWKTTHVGASDISKYITICSKICLSTVAT